MPGNVPPVANEREGLVGYLAQQRQVVRLSVFGLEDEQARLAPTASSLCLGGIVKHLAATERGWMDIVLERISDRDSRGDYEAGFRMGPDDHLQDVLDDYAEAGRETDAIVESIADLSRAVPVPCGVPWFPQDVDAWSVRWVLLHLIEETARHAGHADIVRQAIDGATAFPLMAAAENWPASPWLQRWEPAPDDEAASSG